MQNTYHLPYSLICKTGQPVSGNYFITYNLLLLEEEARDRWITWKSTCSLPVRLQTEPSPQFSATRSLHSSMRGVIHVTEHIHEV